ncbi:HDOD domain-containing protein [Acidithiobacillus sp. CV18-2]|uniref:HDOD domain-containing protein n=1 Tax=Igneacidithiobacillus copahuensis TaxID=2724909 RepID=A0AAE3CKS0_9PROT|nr:HDOD domain-containing protein [Igneacidithiobacillus copahuensis]MBU2753884.1 HDOD domain-containing protein [Acidithiobacillus sp. CV18-3]MBU2757418.1 HDOD domain-containing protein [Acidithiobacillus sp. BN09-2]MBU2777310.1 HDOD domain-containing protein [Acidithiobacillus sp. CV18-2]MBU2796207.1 HDOD domain-containing protein [Acidithiobacillus sp. VAN18-2]MBU2798408.1 HDOD domain-containing protein [Acidithiobacillus sp. VAN18-4]UTV82181.1 HDOD domain-containing protein [Acidithiobaci
MHKRSVQDWAAQLTQQELPLFGATVQRLLAATQNESRSLTEIGQLISRDPAFSSLVLRMVNSVAFNPNSQRILTIPKAILILGLERVRLLCFSALILENTVQAKFQAQVLDLLRKSLELAAQSEFLAEKVGGEKEQHFLAGLLHYIGQITFWCAGGPEAAEVLAQIEEGLSSAEAARQVLGFPFEELDRSLLQQLGLESFYQLSPVAQIDLLEEAKVWLRLQEENRYPALQERMQRLNSVFQQRTPALLRSLKEHRQRTLSLIPPQWLSGDHGPGPVPQWSEADATVQVQILADLHALPVTGAHLPTLLQTVLDGIHRGGGFDRCAFLVRQSDGWRPRLQTGATRQAFSQTPIIEDEALRLVTRGFLPLRLQENESGSHFLEGSGGYSAPVHFQDKVIGLLYADRALSQRKIGPDNRQAFALFWKQLQLLLVSV